MAVRLLGGGGAFLVGDERLRLQRHAVARNVKRTRAVAIEGDNVPWRPERAFDDGRQVFIQFPPGIGQGEMPPLFIIGPEGNTSQLVNYRVRGNYMIVDRLFAAGELRLGGGKTQKRVQIVRTDGVAHRG